MVVLPLTLQLNFLNFREWDNVVFEDVALMHLQGDVGRGNAADALNLKISAGGFEAKDGIALGLGPVHGKKTGQLRLKESAIKGELAARENFRWRRARRLRGLRRGGLLAGDRLL